VEDGYVVGVTRAQRDVVAAEEVMPAFVWLHPATLAAMGVDRKYQPTPASKSPVLVERCRRCWGPAPRGCSRPPVRD
jgi:hypothetical protein